MADEKMNDKEDEQRDQQSQASKETTSFSNPVPVEEDPVAVEEGPVTEAPETDQQPIRNRRSSSPTGEEVEPEGKRPRYAGGSIELPDLIKLLTPGIESWLHSHITEYIPLPPTSTLSIPGVPNNPSRPPRAPKPPKPPRPPGSKLPSSSVSDRLQMLEAEVNNLKDNLNETTESTDDLVIDVGDVETRILNLEDEVEELKRGINDLQADLVDCKLKAKVNYSSESEITTDDNSCSSGGRIRRIPSVDAEMLCAMLLRRIKSGPGSTSGHKPPAGDVPSASKKGKNKAIMIKSDVSQVETKDVTTSHDELKDDNTSLDETMEDITSQDEMKDVIISQDEMKDDNASQDEKMDDDTSQDVMKDDNTSK